MSDRPRPRLLLRVALGALGLLVLYVGFNFVQVWRASNHDGAREADAIIVLGAAQYDGDPSPVLRARLDHAYELWDQDLAPTIVVTGGRQEGDRFTEAAASYDYLRERGVPDDQILREVDGTNTWEQLAATARFLRQRSVNEVVVVTDDYHAYRVEAIAEELGLDASVSPIGSHRSKPARLRALTRETVAVSIGRFIGFRRLVNLDDAVSG